MSCRYTKAFLNGLDLDTLLDYGKAKKILTGTVGAWEGRKTELIDEIFAWLHRENKAASLEEFDQWLAQQKQ